jgi:hydroxymethylglutaryl-CoA synthase
MTSVNVGVDAIQWYIPKLSYSIQKLAILRNIDPVKLEKGLGLLEMSLPDTNEDTVSMGATAVYRLLQTYAIDPKEISRLYVGSESGVDSSKPIGSYVTQLIEDAYGERVFKHCDTVDFTFACIGAFDALQNCMDYIRLHPTEKAIVLATDIAKYDLNSTGEYTQGAGAIALLVTANPSILAFNHVYGVGHEGVFDFFKPRFSISASELKENNAVLEKLQIPEETVSFYREQPVFDGPYSNQCYINRIVEAYKDFVEKIANSEAYFLTWNQIIMHLPYAFQARRTFVEIFALTHDSLQVLSAEDRAQALKNLSKSEEYLALVEQKIASTEKLSGRIGNLYTGSIFLSLMSSLQELFEAENTDFGLKFGFIGYGSGSKSKVTEAVLQRNWKERWGKLTLKKELNDRENIDNETYLKLHKKQLDKPVTSANSIFVLTEIENENPNLKGARYYKLA